MKQISLGTAYWGWSISEIEAHHILNLFYDNGGRFIDSAFNYPINSDPNDLKRSLTILSNWITKNKINDLKINYKVGSISNVYTSENNTSKKYLEDQFKFAEDVLQNNIYSIMIHWDNSSSKVNISNTCLFLKEIQDSGIHVGLSGIKYPNIYSELMRTLKFSPIDLQVKSNFISSNIDNYKFFDSAINRFWGYGIASGGIKIDQNNQVLINSVKKATKNLIVTESMKQSIQRAMEKHQFNSFYELSMTTAENNDSLYGYIIGPSNKPQMKSIIKFLGRSFEN
mgnify:FL=1|tara:strand:- start:4453 stop:5301 length:849 start_codon:yes stop_codon:yes gene_type:complete